MLIVYGLTKFDVNRILNAMMIFINYVDGQTINAARRFGKLLPKDGADINGKLIGLQHQNHVGRTGLTVRYRVELY